MTTAEVELALDVAAGLDVEACCTTRPLGAGLVRDQRLAEQLLGEPSRTPPSAERTSLTPPALPRPPAWICALTTARGSPSSPKALVHFVGRLAGDALC